MTTPDIRVGDTVQYEGVVTNLSALGTNAFFDDHRGFIPVEKLTVIARPERKLTLEITEAEASVLYGKLRTEMPDLGPGDSVYTKLRIALGEES